MICYLGRAQFQFSGWFICKHINITKRERPLSLVFPQCPFSLCSEPYSQLESAHSMLNFSFQRCIFNYKMQITLPVQIVRAFPFFCSPHFKGEFCILCAPTTVLFRKLIHSRSIVRITASLMWLQTFIVPSRLALHDL
jgi:hypothetical protein